MLPGRRAANRASSPQGVTFKPGPQLAPVFQELNVIGERAEEARDRVEKFLDDAVMATASRVRIVHGHGMGVLKKMVAELLARNPHVEKYYPATQAEGGSGATIAELKTKFGRPPSVALQAHRRGSYRGSSRRSSNNRDSCAQSPQS